MKWPWTDRRMREDQEALEETRRRLAEVEGQWPRVREAAEILHRHRERNHFADKIAAIYAGRRP